MPLEVYCHNKRVDLMENRRQPSPRGRRANTYSSPENGASTTSRTSTEGANASGIVFSTMVAYSSSESLVELPAKPVEIGMSVSGSMPCKVTVTSPVLVDGTAG